MLIMIFKGTYINELVNLLKDEITWIVPTADEIPMWQNVFGVLSWPVWLFSVILYISISFIINVTAICSRLKDRKAYLKIDKVLLITLGMVISQPTSIMPKRTRLKILITVWSLFSLYFSSAFTTTLISMLTTPRFGRNVSISNPI